MTKKRSAAAPPKAATPGRRRWLLRMAVVLVVGLGLLAWALWGRSENLLTVENQSGQPIASLEVRISGETRAFANVPPGAEVRDTFPAKSGDHFIVEGELKDGTLIRGRFGYVTNSMFGERVRFLVLPRGEIKFRQAAAAEPR